MQQEIITAEQARRDTEASYEAIINGIMASLNETIKRTTKNGTSWVEYYVATPVRSEVTRQLTDAGYKVSYCASKSDIHKTCYKIEW